MAWEDENHRASQIADSRESVDAQVCAMPTSLQLRFVCNIMCRYDMIYIYIYIYIYIFIYIYIYIFIYIYIYIYIFISLFNDTQKLHNHNL